MKTQNIIVTKSFNFSLLIISFYKKLQKEKEFVISKQLLRSGTSIGANINEAVAGCSKRDFIHKLTISNKEAYESRYWLELLKQSDLTELNVQDLIDELDEIIKILSSILITSKRNLEKL